MRCAVMYPNGTTAAGDIGDDVIAIRSQKDVCLFYWKSTSKVILFIIKCQQTFISNVQEHSTMCIMYTRLKQR